MCLARFLTREEGLKEQSYKEGMQCGSRMGLQGMAAAVFGVVGITVTIRTIVVESTLSQY